MVEYGSSFGAVVAAGTRRALQDTIYELNASHLGAAGGDCLRGARGRRADGRRRSTSPATAAGRRTGRRVRMLDATRIRAEALLLLQPLRVGRDRRPARRAEPAAAGTIDAYAASVGRWLVTRDGFDFLVFYLSDYDYASHAQGPDSAHEALARCDTAIGSLVDAAGGEDEFLERYAVILCSDHGQTDVTEVAHLQAHLPDELVLASNRAGMVYTDRDPRRAGHALRRLPCGRGRPLSRGRRGSGAAGRRRASVRAGREWLRDRRRSGDPRLPRRPRAWLGRAREPERGRACDLGGAGLGIRRPGRPAPRRAAARTARSTRATRRCRC